VVDSYRGPTHRILGDLIREYNDLCNIQGEFNIADRLCVEGVFRHVCASFLGIYGNISSCTALHGISLVSMLDHLDGASVIGDDALARFMLSNMELQEFIDGVSLLGFVNPTKYHVFYDEHLEDDETYPSCWHYAKRPFKRIAGRAYQGLLVDWPLLPYMITSGKPATSYHTVQDYSPGKCLKTWCSQSGRFFDSVRRLDIDLETEELIRCYLECGYRIWGLKFEGSVGHKVDKHNLYSMAYPCIDGTIGFDEDWLDYVAHKDFGASVRLPVLDDGTRTRGAWGVYPWYAKMTELISFGVKMGWLRAMELYEEVVLSAETIDRYIQYIRFRESGVYNLEIAGDVPDWFMDMYIQCLI